MNVPNALTVGRIALVPILAALIVGGSGESVAAVLLFAAAAASDVMDGHIARSRGLVTAFGKMMDPIADKLLVGTALVSLAAVDRVAAWVVVIVLVREAAVSLLRLVARHQGVVVPASAFGKAKMAIQVVTLIVLMAVGDPWAAWVQLVVGTMVTLTVLSGLDYFMNFRRRGEPASIRAVPPPLGGPSGSTRRPA